MYIRARRFIEITEDAPDQLKSATITEKIRFDLYLDPHVAPVKSFKVSRADFEADIGRKVKRGDEFEVCEMKKVKGEQS